MAIATLATLKRLCDSDPPRGKARIGIGDDAGDQVTDASAQSFLDAQEGYIIAYLGYTPVTNALTQEIHGKLTAWHIWIHIIDRSQGEGEIPEYVQKWYDWAMEVLKQAKEGEVSIDSDDAQTPVEAYSSEFRQVRDEEITLQHAYFVQMKYWPVIPGSEVVYSDENKGGTLYVRDTDYVINWKQREIRALSGGAIANLQKVYVSYMHIESKQMHKSPERVDYANRSGTPGWEGIFGS